MYERFYELRERPFALSPDPDYLYPSRVHREALDYLRYGLESQAGFVVITGEIGSGKTTLLQTLLRGLDAQTTVGRIVNTMLEPRELLETIMIDFGLDPTGRSKPVLLRDLAQYLVDQRLAGRLVLLVIDEAQNLSLATLEELRMLSNLETEKSKLLQIILVGQPSLRDKLAAPELEQLRQRITVSYHLAPLDSDETAKYINHRLRRAALGAPLEFPRDVTDIIHARSRGVPRITNVICDAALVFGYAEERRQVDQALMAEVLAELEATGVLPTSTSAPATRVAGGWTPASEITNGAAGVRPAIAPPAGTLFTPGAVAVAQQGSSSAQPGLAPHAEVPISQPVARSLQPGSASAAPPVGGVAGGVERRVDPAPVAGRIEALIERAALLDQREQALRQRERELAEQRRILAEEYRLLRAQRPPAAPAPAVAPASSHVRVHVARPGGAAPAPFAPARQETIWSRIKRVVLGSAAPAVGEN